MLQQAEDLRAEAHALCRLLEPLVDADWDRATQFKDWTINDIVQHLDSGDERAIASITDPAMFDELVAQSRAARTAGLSRITETRRQFGSLTGGRLLAHWHDQLGTLCGMVARLQPDQRLKWSGPSMGARSFTSARQMETWAHGQAVYDLLGVERPQADRLRHIAQLGVRTFGWTFANRGDAVPAEKPYVRLAAPSGTLWEWNAPSAANRVEGEAFEFCQVVAQVRNVADTQLSVIGPVAQSWMAVAQCFAGPPENPPAPGTRYRVAA